MSYDLNSSFMLTNKYIPHKTSFFIFDTLFATHLLNLLNAVLTFLLHAKPHCQFSDSSMKKKHKKGQTIKAPIDTLQKTGSTWLCVSVTAPIHLLSHSSCVFMLRQVTALSHSSSFRDVVRMVHVFHVTVSKRSACSERKIKTGGWKFNTFLLTWVSFCPNMFWLHLTHI